VTEEKRKTENNHITVSSYPTKEVSFLTSNDVSSDTLIITIKGEAGKVSSLNVS